MAANTESQQCARKNVAEFIEFLETHERNPKIFCTCNACGAIAQMDPRPSCATCGVCTTSLKTPIFYIFFQCPVEYLIDEYGKYCVPETLGALSSVRAKCFGCEEIGIPTYVYNNT